MNFFRKTGILRALSTAAILVNSSDATLAEEGGILAEGDIVSSSITQSHGQVIDGDSLIFDQEKLNRFIDAQVESLRFTAIMNRSYLPVGLTIYGSKVQVGMKKVVRRYDLSGEKKRVPNMKPIYETFYVDIFVSDYRSGTRSRTVRDPNNPYRKITIPGTPAKMKKKRVKQKRVIGWRKQGTKTVC